MIKPDEFIDLIVKKVVAIVVKMLPLAFRIGTIPGSYVSGMPTITFDGESAPSTKAYPYLSSYTPTANDRVLIALVGHSGVILGKIINS